MKMFLMSMFIPCSLFCCQECIEIIEDKIECVTAEIIHQIKLGEDGDDQYFMYLVGRGEALWECLLMLQHEGS